MTVKLTFTTPGAPPHDRGRTTYWRAGVERAVEQKLLKVRYDPTTTDKRVKTQRWSVAVWLDMGWVTLLERVDAGDMPVWLEGQIEDRHVAILAGIVLGLEVWERQP